LAALVAPAPAQPKADAVPDNETAAKIGSAFLEAALGKDDFESKFGNDSFEAQLDGDVWSVRPIAPTTPLPPNVIEIPIGGWIVKLSKRDGHLITIRHFI
jgi:hypothetical protein